MVVWYHSTMIQNIEISNFQSLHKVNIELGGFTVIVGPSSSGKSAFLRAVKTLASNSRGHSYVTHGKKVASITAKGQNWTASIERGDGVGSYKTSIDDDSRIYTKLSGSVPKDVSALLKIAPISSGGEIHFAGQFDKPYLLDESGQSVARILGDLTNVSVILEAVREANRKRGSLVSELKLKEEKLKDLSSKMVEFRDLNTEVSVVSTLEAKLPEVRNLDLKIKNLNSTILDIQEQEKLLDSLNSRELPDMAELDKLQNNFQFLKSTLFTIDTKIAYVQESSEYLVELSKNMEEMQQKLSVLLIEHGQCPVCGSRTS